MNGMYGKKRPDLVKRNKENPMVRENNPSWQGGKSFEPYSAEFNKKLKAKIKERDNYICQLCSDNFPVRKISNNRFLTIHHIDYDKKNSMENNLIALCNFCNSSVNTSREQWTSFFKEKLQGVTFQ